MAGTLTINGKSGNSYIFQIYEISVKFNGGGGVYLFTKLMGDKLTHKSVYLGITNDLSTRFNNHHKKDCIKNNGATHLCVLINNNETERNAIEEDLLGAINTLCNDQKK